MNHVMWLYKRNTLKASQFICMHIVLFAFLYFLSFTANLTLLNKPCYLSIKRIQMILALSVLISLIESGLDLPYIFFLLLLLLKLCLYEKCYTWFKKF